LLKAIPGRVWLLIVEIFTLVSRANLDEHRKEKSERRSTCFPYCPSIRFKLKNSRLWIEILETKKAEPN
jgi:hypothetical protein